MQDILLHARMSLVRSTVSHQLSALSVSMVTLVTMLFISSVSSSIRVHTLSGTLASPRLLRFSWPDLLACFTIWGWRSSVSWPQ